MRALAKLFEIASILIAIVTLVFLLAAVEGNAPPPIQRQYIHATLFAAISLLATIAACLFCVARITPHTQADTSPTPLHPPSLRVITKLLQIFTLLFLVISLFSLAIISNSKGPRPPDDPYLPTCYLSLAAGILCTILSELINARWKKQKQKHHHPIPEAEADDPPQPGP